MVEPLDSVAHAEIDHALQAWRQGDCVLGDDWFVFRSDISRPLTQEGRAAAAEGLDLAECRVFGFMVLTQTCDIVRRCSERPFVEVSPLVEVEEPRLREIRRMIRPNLAFVPNLAQQRLVADLDRVMTVEKAVVARWHRTVGWQTDDDARRLREALKRKRTRVAFPDDFTAFAKPLLERMSSKHDKASYEGSELRSLREVRVRAEPSWDAHEVRLVFWFVRHEHDSGGDWVRALEAWETLLRVRGRFMDVQALVTTLDDMTARDYAESDPLDLDHLSTRDG